MSCAVLVSSSDGVRPLAVLPEGARGVVLDIQAPGGVPADRISRLLALGVTPGASIRVLQTVPGIVFLCDQTELAIERAVADAIIVRLGEG
jgi:Fe2+ transport system protein FeoA